MPSSSCVAHVHTKLKWCWLFLLRLTWRTIISSINIPEVNPSDWSLFSDCPRPSIYRLYLDLKVDAAAFPFSHHSLLKLPVISVWIPLIWASASVKCAVVSKFTRMIWLFWRNYFTRNYILIARCTQDTYLSNLGEVEKFAAGKKYYYFCLN